MDLAALYLGAVVVCLVAARLGVETLAAVRNYSQQRSRDELSRILMLERIEAAKALRGRLEQAKLGWNGYRKFKVHRKVHEADNICSFYLEPHDGKQLPAFLPGQYLTFELQVPPHDKPVVRCYSLSDAPRPDYYRVTIKRIGPPPEAPDAPAGVSSSYFYETVEESDLLNVKAPGGRFTLEPTVPRPVVMIAGGVGVTPFVSMINAIAEAPMAREAWLFYGVRNGAEHAMKAPLRKIAQEHDHIRIVTAYSSPRDEDVAREDFDHQGRIDLDLLRKCLPSSNYEFYICGPPAMMQSIHQGLQDWGVPKHDIHTEAFGPASIQAKKKAVAPAPAAATEKIVVTFAKSGKAITWTDDASTILDLAERNHLYLPCGCRAGSCKDCQLAVRSGEVVYDEAPECEIDEGCCLTCVGRPKGNVTLDA